MSYMFAEKQESLSLSIHQIAWEEVQKLGGLAPLKKIYQLVVDRIRIMEEPMPRLDSIRGAVVDKTIGTGRRANNGEYLFERVEKGIYKIVTDEDVFCVLNESSRDMSVLEDESVDVILADHPWDEGSNHKSGNQKGFADDYADTTFAYTLEDFQAKYRVLKPGGFCLENLPAENGVNSDYLVKIRLMAKEAGFKVYSFTPWVKFKTPKNTGRTQKDREYVLTLYKPDHNGKPRRLAPQGKPYFTKTMIPAAFDIPAPHNKTHQAEKPVQLYEKLLELFSEPNDVIVDQFGGSGNSAVAALKLKRYPIVYELMEKYAKKISDKLKLDKLFNFSIKGDKKKSEEVKLELVFNENGQASLF